MCFKPSRSKLDAKRAQWEEQARRPPDRPHPGTRTRPRGNGDVDRRDVERGTEKLGALVGR